jgi:hypothetical protein
VSRDLSYRLDIVRRSLASTTRSDGSLELSRDGVIELLELLQAAGVAAGELTRLRERVLEVVNDPTNRTVTIPLRQVAAVLQSE